MMLTAEKLRLKKLLSESISLLCRNSVQFQSNFSVEALIGITLDENEVVLISIKETVAPDGNPIPQEWLDDSLDNVDETDVPLLEVDHDFDFGSQPETTWSNPAEYNGPAKHRLKTDHRRNIKKFRDNIKPKVNSASKVQMFNVKREVEDIKNEEQITGSDFVETNYLNKDEEDFEDGSIKMEATEIFDNDGVDDCVIVKNEELNYFDYYDDGCPQKWNTQNDSFNGNNDFTQIPSKSTTVRKSLTSATDPDWLPCGQNQISRKYCAVEQRRPFGTKRISSVSTKSRKMSIATKIQMKTSEVYNSNVNSKELFENGIDLAQWQRSDYVCKICGVNVNSVRSLRDHVNGVHLNMKMYQCDLCPQTFKWRMALSRHRRNYHHLSADNWINNQK